MNDHGYYTFPTYYGNTYNVTSTSSYKYQGARDEIPAAVDTLVLKDFVDYNNDEIGQGSISGVTDAVLLWQDSPDLVTDVKYSNGNVFSMYPKRPSTKAMP